MNTHLFQLVFLAQFLSFSSYTYSDVYKWKDANGRLHYSDMRPINAEEQRLDVRSGTAPAIPPAAKSMTEREMEFRKRQLEADENAAKEKQQVAETKEREKNCSQARGNLRSLESGTRLVKYDAKGEQVYIEDRERPALIEESKKAISAWCK